MAEQVPTTSTPARGRRHLLSAAPAVMVLAGAGIGAELVAAQKRGEIAARNEPVSQYVQDPDIPKKPTLSDIGIPPDAELVALCAQLDALEHEFLATDFGARPGTAAGDHAEAEQDRLLAAQDPIVDAICNLPCTTHEGAIAVARSLALWDAEFFKRGGPDDYTNNRLIVALVRGLTGRAAA